LARPSRSLIALAAVAVLVGGGLVVTGLFRGSPRGTAAAAAAATASSPMAASSPTGTPRTTCAASPWGCAQEQRFAAAKALIKKRPGQLGIVVQDRVTGEVWEAGTPSHLTWTASTIKLAMVTSLLERHRSGEITLDAKARQQIADMLSVSSNEAADALWSRYGKAAMVNRFRTVYGMRGLTFVDGFDRYWGFMKCTARDLAALMSYVLDRLNQDDRAYVIGAMRAVGSVQQWGVWAAGKALHPGTKDGWSLEKDAGSKHWVTNTVGFAGDNERYIVAVMYHLPPGSGTLDGGVHAVTDLVATVFGQPVPAHAVIPPPD
jgi:hypothetical protein